MATDITPFTRRVVSAVKAELARAGCDGADLVPVLGLGRNAVYARLRCEKPFSVNEVALIAAFLDIPITVLVAEHPQAVAA